MRTAEEVQKESNDFDENVRYEDDDDDDHHDVDHDGDDHNGDGGGDGDGDDDPDLDDDKTAWGGWLWRRRAGNLSISSSCQTSLPTGCFGGHHTLAAWALSLVYPL